VYRQKLRECFSRGVGCGRGQPKVNDECLTDAKQNAERRIEERFRFLLERDSNTSILRSFRITDISAPIFPNTNARSAAVSLDEHQLRTVFLAVAVWLSASRSSSLNLRRRGHPPMLCDGRPPGEAIKGLRITDALFKSVHQLDCVAGLACRVLRPIKKKGK
jgi:hypothetical protein